MAEKELIASGIGDVPSWLANEGLELAEKYFEDHDLIPEDCYEAYNNGNNSQLANYWVQAEKIANNVLAGDERYENSMINLEFDEY